MESNPEHADSMKTPRRTRRSSTTESDPGSHHKRSTRKTIMPSIDETEGASSNTDPVTPSRSSRVLDFQTPKRSDAVDAAQTPRRSVRKSIKPVQEYENIVAQKGLSIKRVAGSSVDDEEAVAEAKWMPAVIGRVSSKRGKKAKREKNKRLQRQKKIAEDEALAKQCAEENLYQMNDENGMKDNVEVYNNETPQNGGVILHVDERLSDKPFEVNLHNDVKLDSTTKCDNENPIENEKFLGNNKILENEDENHPEQKIVIMIDANEKESTELPSSEIYKEENEEISDSSIEGGDTEMAAMPITADDCMDSPEKASLLSPTDEPVNSITTAADDSDCVMLSMNESSDTEQLDDGTQTTTHDSCDSTGNNMPPLLICSDDEEEEEVMEANPKIENVTASIKEEVDQNEKPLPSESDQITRLNSTFDAEKTPPKNTDSFVPQTPVLRPSITRIPTPFKSSKAIVPDIIVEPEEEMDSDDTPDVLMEPREIRLKSSRKRSFSICTDRPKKIVTFHSPANTMVSIYDGDYIRSPTKENINHTTQGRKRSLSVTETEREMVAYFKQKNTPENTPDKRRKLQQPSSRSKMPNFAAIHQQQFQRMESISDHVARKAERAKILSNSTTKVRPASIQKGLPVKNSILREFNKDASVTKANSAMPKARQRIELSGIVHKHKIEGNSLHADMKIRSKSKQDLSTLDDFPSIGKMSSKMSASTIVFTGNTTKSKPLSRPKFNLSTNTLNAPLNSASSSKSTTTTSKAAANTTIASVSQNLSTLPDSRSKFNPSTANNQGPVSTGKLDVRRKQLMGMFKSRSTPREKNREILKGVRTNRRFELQMMCRNRQN